jgi:methylthioribose-1-phosphate isomerase
MPLKVIDWQHDRMVILDQTLLPQAEVCRELNTVAEAVTAIRELQVRGAPAIGIAAGYAVCLGALNINTDDAAAFRRELDNVIAEINASRPTARNLFRATERMRQAATTADDPAQIKAALLKEATAIQNDEEAATRRISELGAALLPIGAAVLTHCNAGALATATTYGTALGVIIMAHEQGKKVSVLATETRPLLQGARLTAWELQKAGVPTRLITDSMAGHFMKAGNIDCVITGADRIARNGDSANKIGTYQLAVLAREHNIPFYIAAPVSTVDMSLASGDEIPIEERDGSEVTAVRGAAIAPDGMAAYNPAFDVTPAGFISAIITERGIIRAPYQAGLEGIIH